MDTLIQLTGTLSTPVGFLLPHEGSPLSLSLGNRSDLVELSGFVDCGGSVIDDGLAGVVVGGGGLVVPQSPKSRSSSVHSTGSPTQQSSPKISQFSSLGTHTSFGCGASQHPVPKRRQSGSSTQGAAVSQHFVPKSSQSGCEVQSSSFVTSGCLGGLPPLGKQPNLSRYSSSY